MTKYLFSQTNNSHRTKKKSYIYWYYYGYQEYTFWNTAKISLSLSLSQHIAQLDSFFLVVIFLWMMPSNHMWGGTNIILYFILIYVFNIIWWNSMNRLEFILNRFIHYCFIIYYVQHRMRNLWEWLPISCMFFCRKRLFIWQGSQKIWKLSVCRRLSLVQSITN